MTVIGALSSFRKLGEMSHHKRAIRHLAVKSPCRTDDLEELYFRITGNRNLSRPAFNWPVALPRCGGNQLHVQADCRCQPFFAANQIQSVRPARWVSPQEQSLAMCNTPRLATPVGIPGRPLQKWRKGDVRQSSRRQSWPNYSLAQMQQSFRPRSRCGGPREDSPFREMPCHLILRSVGR